MLSDPDKDRFRKVEPEAEEVFRRTLGYYLEHGSPDISKGDSALECGLAYGYVLDETYGLYESASSG